ncbi:hypothetical protein MPSEU_000041200 [Mayamaea pseudoterrestris]|nr:hypothetical protein MPSEU_000041200 [Mayamaea pseudoterrestris]
MAKLKTRLWAVNLLGLFDSSSCFAVRYPKQLQQQALPQKLIHPNAASVYLSPKIRAVLQNVKLVLAPPFVDEDVMAFPLPADHLPYELSGMGLGGVRLSTREHRRFFRHAFLEQGGRMGIVALHDGRANKSLVGAVGCVVQAFCAESLREDDEIKSTGVSPKLSPLVSTNGKWRFIVKEVLSTNPFPVVLVDELFDQKVIDKTRPRDGKGNDSQELSKGVERHEADELMATLMDAMHAHVHQHLKKAEPEQSNVQCQKARALDYVSRIIDDLYPSIEEKYYCIGLLSMEFVRLTNDERRIYLSMTDSVERMRVMLGLLRQQLSVSDAGSNLGLTVNNDVEPVGLLAAKNVENDKRPLPASFAWDTKLLPGMIVEYYYNDELGWCRGKVMTESIVTFDGSMVKVYFPHLKKSPCLFIDEKESSRVRLVDEEADSAPKAKER